MFVQHLGLCYNFAATCLNGNQMPKIAAKKYEQFNQFFAVLR